MASVRLLWAIFVVYAVQACPRDHSPTTSRPKTIAVEILSATHTTTTTQPPVTCDTISRNGVQYVQE